MTTQFLSRWNCAFPGYAFSVLLLAFCCCRSVPATAQINTGGDSFPSGDSQIHDDAGSTGVGSNGFGGVLFGGVTANDFVQLIDLITNTIANDTWLETGAGLGTIQAYPSGVFVDSTGTLMNIPVDAKLNFCKVGKRFQPFSTNRETQNPTTMRTVSINRLEFAAQKLAQSGRPLDVDMLNLAGLTEIQYLAVLPESGDVVIAGPAGPWEYDSQARAVNAKTGKPVLRLDDLVVCLRNSIENNGKFGCAITPRQQNLAATINFVSTSRLTGKRWSKKLRELLGQQDIEVFGIDGGTHAARVLVEADYRMKLMGMGLEPSIASVPSYFDRIQLQDDGSVPPMDVVRWWFTLNYDSISSDPAGHVFAFAGNGVQVLSETEFLNAQGQRIHTGQSHGPTKSFAEDFTKHFVEIADTYPIYRELKNVFDLAFVAGLIKNQKLAQEIDWRLNFFASTNGDQPTYRVSHAPAATRVDSVMNERAMKFRKRHSTLKHTIVGVSGGISYDVNQALSSAKVTDLDGSRLKTQLKRDTDSANIWWWD